MRAYIIFMGLMLLALTSGVKACDVDTRDHDEALEDCEQFSGVYDFETGDCTLGSWNGLELTWEFTDVLS